MGVRVYFLLVGWRACVMAGQSGKGEEGPFPLHFLAPWIILPFLFPWWFGGGDRTDGLAV
jgi:hypothetical protein